MCRYDEYLPCRIPTLNKYFSERISSLGISTYIASSLDSDNALLKCFGMELVVPEGNLLKALSGKISEFDADALDVRVRLIRS